MSDMIDPLPRPVAERPLLVGRERERGSLRQALDASMNGRGALVLVSGEAGIGKTTLVEDLAWQARQCGVLVFSGGCYDLATSPPNGAWREAFRRYVPNGLLPPLPAFLSSAERSSHDSTTDLVRQFMTFLTRVTAIAPLVIILEDLHWADQSSLDLLYSLSHRLRELPLLLMATWRVDELNRRHVLYRLIPSLVREAGGMRLDLRPLSELEQLAFIDARYQLSSVDRHRLATYLHQYAEGNPFFISEVLRTLEEESLLRPFDTDDWTLGDLSSAPIPELVRQVIEARVARVGADAERLLRLAAVIGHDVPLDLWRSLAGVDEATFGSAVQRMTDAHLLQEEPPNGYRFSHALVREAIYNGVVLPARQAMHRAAAEWLTERVIVDPDAVADHFRRAADPRAAEWLLRAGESARRQFAPRVAIERFTLALSTDGLGDHGRIHAHLQRGEAFETLGEFSAAITEFDHAVRRARDLDDWNLEWQALLDLGAAWSPSNYQRTGAYYRQALDLARARGEQTALAISLNRLGNWHFNVLQLGDAIGLHQEALTILEHGDRTLHLAQTHDFLAMTYWCKGDGVQGSMHWNAAIRLFEHLEDRQLLASALNNSIAVSQVDFPVVASESAEMGLTSITRALQIAREIEWRAGEVFAQVNLARFQMLQGQIDQALENHSAAIALAESIGHREWAVAGWWTLSMTQAAVGQFDGARESLERGLALARETRSLFWIQLVSDRLVSILVKDNRLSEAQALLDSQPESTIADLSSGSLHASQHCLALAELALARNDASRALALIEANIASLPNSQRAVVPSLSILRGRALASLGRLTEARDAFVAARARLAQYDELPARLVACAELARAAAQLGEVRLSTEALDEAHEIVAAIMSHLPDDMRSSFQSYAERLFASDHRISPAAIAGLSAREVEVLQLVAEGLTDVEVARRLYLSRRTVSSHLRSIYGKLDVSTRTAAARLAIERDII